MKLLLDTHAYIWWTTEPKRLSARARKAISAAAAEIYVSAISAYEIAYKNRIGLLPKVEPLLMNLDGDLAERGFVSLAVSLEHGRRAGELDPAHRDPFDRLLAAQSIVERMPIVSNDSKLQELGAVLVW